MQSLEQDLERKLEQKIADAWPVDSWRDVTVVLAVSGGADSMALMRAVAALVRRSPGQGRVVVAHLNHCLRGDESDGDAEFVRHAAESLGLISETARAAVAKRAKRDGDGIEAAARAERYEFLRDVAERFGARYVATAHTADDQAETILHRILRGTAIGGLAGIETFSHFTDATSLVRPMLSVRRQEVVDYLEQLGQPYRDDATNDDLTLTRNRIRRELLPHLAENYNPRIVDALLRLGMAARDAKKIIVRPAETLIESAVETASDGVSIRLAELADAPDELVKTMFVLLWTRRNWPRQAMGHAEWTALAAMCRDASSLVRIFAGAIRAERHEDRLVLTRGGE